MTNPLMSALALMERGAAFLQGKGYGGASTKHEVASAIKLLGRAPKTVVDAGANIGDWSAALRAAAPAASVHLFEPAAVNITKLSQRFAADTAITIAPFALSDVPGETTLFADAEGSGKASLAKRDISHHGLTFDYSETIKAVRFDDYWRERMDGRPIDIAKLDVEGHELSALRGFGDALDMVDVIQFEFGGTALDTRIFFRDFWQLLSDHRFAIYRIAPLGLLPITRYKEREEVFTIANYLARRQT